MALECQPGWICQSTSPSVSLQISSSRVPEFRSFACWMVSHSWYLPYSGATDSGQPSGAKTEISSCRLGAMAPSDGKSLGIFGEMGKSSMAFVWCETSHFCEKLEKHVMQKVPKKKQVSDLGHLYISWSGRKKRSGVSFWLKVNRMWNWIYHIWYRNISSVSIIYVP